MTNNRTSLFVVLVALICGPQIVVAEDSARPTSKPPCAPPEECVRPDKPTSADTIQTTPSNPEPKADKKSKKKKAAKSDKIEKQTSPTATDAEKTKPNSVVQPAPEKSTRAIVTKQPFGPKELANRECPKPYGPFTPNYCREGPRPSGTSASTSAGGATGTSGRVSRTQPRLIAPRVSRRYDEKRSGGHRRGLNVERRTFRLA